MKHIEFIVESEYIPPSLKIQLDKIMKPQVIASSLKVDIGSIPLFIVNDKIHYLDNLAKQKPSEWPIELRDKLVLYYRHASNELGMAMDNALRAQGTIPTDPEQLRITRFALLNQLWIEMKESQYVMESL